MSLILHRLSILSNLLRPKHLRYFTVSSFTIQPPGRMDSTRRTLFTPVPFQHEKKLLKQDGLSSDYQLIYRIQKSYFYVTCAFAGYASLIIMALLIYKRVNDDNLMKARSSEELMREVGTSLFNFDEGEIKMTFATAVFVSAFIYVFTKRFPLRIYYNGDKYVAVFMNTFFPALKTKYSFTCGRRNKNTFAILRSTAFILGRRRARLYPDQFRRPVDLHLMISGFYDDGNADSGLY